MLNGLPNGRSGLMGFGAVLSLGLIVSTWIGSSALERVKRAGQAITVKGYAERKITSDHAVWRGRLTVRGQELVPTYEELTRQLAAVQAWLKAQGVPEKAVEISPAGTEVQYALSPEGLTTNRVAGYVLTQTVDVEGPDIALVAKVSREATGLIRDGIEIASDPPQYFYTKINDLKITMLAEATRDARVRAEQLAANSGGRVGALHSAEQGVFQITGVHSTEVSGYGELDTASIFKSIKAVVTIAYGID